MSSRKLVFVIGSLEVGGAESHLVQVLPRLREIGWHPSVFCLSHRGRMAPDLEHAGVDVHAAPVASRADASPVFRVWRLLRAGLSLAVFLVRHRPGVVHFFLPQAYLMGGLVSLLVGPRCRLMSRRSRNLYQDKHPLMRRLELRLHRRMRAVLANSRAVATDLVQEGVPDDRLALIYNGLDVAARTARRSRAEVRESLGLSEQTLVMLQVANLIPYKGHSDLLEALSDLRIDGPWHLLCAGYSLGDQREALSKQAARLGLEDRVTFLGQRSDIADLIAAADIGVLASHEEGFSNAVLEYMAGSLGVVVTAVGGNPEAILDGECGRVVRPHNPAGLARALEEMADPDLRHRLGARARVRLVEKFSASVCVERYDQLYQAVLADQPVPEPLRVHAASNGADG